MMSHNIRMQKILGLNSNQRHSSSSGYQNYQNTQGYRPNSKLKISQNQSLLNFQINVDYSDKLAPVPKEIPGFKGQKEMVDYSLKQMNQDFIGSGRKFGQPLPQCEQPSTIVGGPNLKKLKEQAMASQDRLCNDLLDKFRNKPKLLSSNPLEQLKQDEKNMKNSNMLNLEQYDDEEMLFFKDQIMNGTYVKPSGPSKQQNQKEKKQIVMHIDDDEDELEILSEHLDNDDNDDEIQKKGIFQYITQEKQEKDSIDFKSRGLKYNSTNTNYTSAIQKSFHDKYFKDPQQSLDIKSMAKSNSFLKSKPSTNPIVRSEVKPILNPTSCIKKSSLCKTKQQQQPLTPYDYASFNTKRDFEEVQALIKQKHTEQLDKAHRKKMEDLQKLKMQKELLKRKRILEAKKKQDEVLEDLFQYAQGKETENKYQGLKQLEEVSSSGSASESEEEKNSPNNEDQEMNDENDAEKQEAHERRLKYIREIQEQRQRDELNEKLRKARYEKRYNVDELVQPILNLDLINNYAAGGEFSPQNQQFPEVPIQFESTEQYFQIWLELFLYETYNQLINQRNESEKDREISQLYGMKNKNDNSQKNFCGFLQRSKQDHKFIYLKLSEKKDDKEENNDGKQNKKYNFPHLNSLKEFDLLLLSKEELDVKNVKKLTSSKFLKDIQSEPGKMMAMVNQKRQQDKTFLELKVDISHDKYVNLNCSEYDYYEMYVYYFDSMSTRIREFRTVKSAEFYPTAQFILNPSLIPKREVQGSLLQNSIMKPPSDKMQGQMKVFVQKNENKFNKSQYQALMDVSNMKPVDFLLIQGPPGTGKTHTIKGIISMLNQALGRSKKILVCAPSNAAIDEIVTRLISKGGLFGQSEQESIKKVLRIGSFDYEPSEIVKQVLFDTKFQEGQLLQESLDDQEKNEAQKLRWQDHIKCVEKIMKIIKSSKNDEEVNNNKEVRECATKILADKTQIDAFMDYDKDKKLNKVKAYKEVVQKSLLEMEKSRNSPNKNMSKAQRKALEKKIVEQTQIICTTLAMSTNEKLECLKPGDIEYLIVDEACQSVELNNLIPFEHQPQRVILVGDQQQLPATTFSENAEKTNYSRSMFERFLKCGIDRVMLEIQYRMDPVIREFPSSQFYENRLKDDASIVSRIETSEYKNSSVASINTVLSPVMFFDLLYSNENDSEKSKINLDEVAFIEKLITKFVNTVAQKNSQNVKFEKAIEPPSRYQKQQALRGLKGSIGIISPYKSQVRSLKEKLFKLLRSVYDINSPQDYLEINTVDAFQGREKDIIIFSCVRSNKEQGLGFVSDYRRMNVAITRAKHCLYIVGNQSTLNRDKNWRELISYTKSKKSFKEFKSKDDDIIQTPRSPKYNNKPVQQSPKDSNKSRSEKDQNQGLSGLSELLSGKSSAKKSPLLPIDGKKSIQKKPLLPDQGKQSPQKQPLIPQKLSATDKEKQQDSNQSVINIRRKYSEENEEGQILSSGQMADKQATEAEDVPDSSSQTNKKRKSKEEGQLSNSDIQSSYYESYSSNKVYGKKHHYQQSKENQKSALDQELGEIRNDKSSERHFQQRNQNGNYRPRNNYHNNNNEWGNSKNDNWGDNNYNNNDWGSSSVHSRGNHHYQAPSQPRSNYRAPNHHNRSQSRHNDQHWKKRDQKEHYKNYSRSSQERGGYYHQPRGNYNGYNKKPRY